MSYYQASQRGNEDNANDVEMGHLIQKSSLPRTASGYIITNSSSPVPYQASSSSATMSSEFYTAERSVPRLLDRSRGLHQSTGKLYVKKRIQQDEWWALYGYDWFHSLVDAPTSRIIAILLVSYVSIVAFFGLIYYWIRKTYYCEMNFDTYMGAFDLSLEVMATFGFSTTIDKCVYSTVAVLIQSCLRLIVESVTIGILYSRVARPSSRASTVLFSNHAIIRRIRGKLYFMFQLCELRKHQLVEAHVRLYAVKRENDGHIVDSVVDKNQKKKMIPIASYIQTSSMRLNHPNDELGGMLLLMMPQVVVHELDSSSPLMAPPIWAPNHPIKRDAKSSKLKAAMQREVIRWNPPVYRKFLRMTNNTTSAESKTSNSTNGSVHWEYDTDILSNMAFPNVHRRGADITAAAAVSTMHATPSSHYPTTGHTGHQQQLLPPRSTISSNNALSSTPALHTPKKSHSKDSQTKSSSSKDVWQTANVNTPIPVSSPRPPNKTDLSLLSRNTLQDTLLSPGLERYEGHFQSVTSGVATTSTSSATAALRQRRKYHDIVDKLKDTSEEFIGSSDEEEDDDNEDAEEIVAYSISQQNNLKGNSTKHTLQPQKRTAHEFQITNPEFMEEEYDDVGTENTDYHSTSNNLHLHSSEYDTEPLWQREERDMLQRYLTDRQVEIIAVVEGIDAATGGNVQARHSYVIDEIAWNKSFAYCLYEDPADRLPTVDFALFHTMEDAPTDAAFCGPISSVV